MKIEDGESIKKILSDGIGVAALLGQSVFEELQAGKLVKVNLDTGPIYVNLRLISRPDKYITPAQKNFLKFFKSIISELSIQTQIDSKTPLDKPTTAQ